MLYLEISCQNDVTNLWLSFSIPTKNCVKAQTDPSCPECAESAKHSDFQKLWEVLMIRVTSEAIYETAGSMMNQHCGKNRFLQPENFNIEMYLKFNLGPLHLLDNFV